jgi:hypothetical protein
MSGESINVNDADKWCRRLFPITNKTLTLIDWDTLVEIDEQVWHQRISGVYFVQPKQGGPIKIGTTRSNLIENRISALQTGNPYPLILLRIVYGDVTVEHEIHRRLANYRLKGEWFIPTNEVLRYALGREVDDLHSWNKCQSDWTLGYREGFAAGREIGQQQGYSQGVHETSDLLKEIFSQSLQRAKGLKKQAFDQMYFSLVRENNNFQIDDEQKQTNLLNQFRGWRQTEEPA